MRRRFGPPVRLEVEETIDPHVLDLLVRELGIGAEEVVALPGPLDLTALWASTRLDRAPTSSYPPFLAAHQPRPRRRRDRRRRPTSSRRMRDHDVLLHHPYDSFSTSVQALPRAGRRPTRRCSRSSRRSTAPAATPRSSTPSIDAAEAGKQVLALVEIKARFDEQANIELGAQARAGRLPRRLRPRRAQDALQALAGRPRGGRPAAPLLPHRHRQLPPEDRAALRGPRPAHRRRRRSARTSPACSTCSPATRCETEYRPAARRAALGARPGWSSGSSARSRTTGPGRPARIRIKVNSIVDEAIIDALYRASQAGVPVDIWVRGICALRAGRARAVREHPGAQHPRPLPGALADLLVRQRRRARGLDRQRRHDAPQPRPPRRGAGAAHRPRARRASSAELLDLGFADTTRPGSWTRRHVAARDDRPRRDAAARPAGAH